MQTLERLRRKIDVAEDLQSIVTTMKTLAVVNIRHYDQAVVSLADYNRTIEMGLQVVLRSGLGETSARSLSTGGNLGAVVFGSDQGLCGRFNEHIVSHALEAMNAFDPSPPDRVVMGVGARTYSLLEEARQPVEDLISLPTSLAGVTPMVRAVLLKLDEWQANRDVSRVMLFYNKPLSSVSYQPHTVHLLPLDREWLNRLAEKPWPSRVLPTYTMDRERLFSALIRQYLFVSVYRAFAESVTSENASRLASLQAAEKSIEESLEELNSQYHQQRQDAITEELLDIVAGFEALAGPTVG